MPTITAPKERPILFNGEMVRAILAGRKTQTRRPIRRDIRLWESPERPGFFGYHNESGSGGLWRGENEAALHGAGKCPFGQVGDRLYVRETWAAPHPYDGMPPRFIGEHAPFHYAATEPRGGLLWRPSIHMPRWAARIFLEVTDVRAERAEDISLEDMLAEGLPPLGVTEDGDDAMREQWAELWESIYGAGSLDKWVWVGEFKRVEA